MSLRHLALYTSTMAVGLALGLLLSGAGCNSYDLLVHDHFAQAAFSNKVDILWLVDSSNSMQQDQENLKASFAAFINELAGGPGGGEEGEQTLELNTLTDAVLVYEEFLGNRTQFLNYQMGVTTTQNLPCEHDPTAFDDCQDSTGTMGRLRSLANAGQDVSHPPTFLRPGDDNLIPDFQYLVEVGIDGATEEYGLWVVAQVVCGSLEMPFQSDFPGDFSGSIYDCDYQNWNDTHDWAEFCHCLPPELYDYNIDEGGERFLRDNSTLVVIVVTDEGDFTPNMSDASGTQWPWDIGDCVIDEPWPLDKQEQCEANPAVLCEIECQIDKFLQFYERLDRRVVFAVIGPGAHFEIDDAGNRTLEVECNDQNSTIPMMEFYLWAAELTNGLYAPINVRNDAGECVDANFDEVLSDLGRLISNLASGWHLSSVPDISTVYVFVDGEEVPPAECLPDDEDCSPSSYNPSCTDQPGAGLNGWTYDEGTQSIKFHGDCIPDYNAVVDIYYLPESGGGRPLPF